MADKPLEYPPHLLAIILCSPSLTSYNAMKYTLQNGNVNHSLPATTHLLCAMCAGNTLSLSTTHRHSLYLLPPQAC